MQVFAVPSSDEFEWADISAGPEAIFDTLLAEAGIPLAPRQRRLTEKDAEAGDSRAVS
jgi:hypothetical protein